MMMLLVDFASVIVLMIGEQNSPEILALKTGLMNQSEEMAMASAVVQTDDCTKPEQEQSQCIRVKRSLEMISGAFYLPKDKTLKPLGEDAHFLYPEKQTIGVADGVGGWAEVGVDSGEFARKLMMNAVIAIRTEPKGTIDPKKILTKAYSKTDQKGASTACILTLSGHNLHAANVGDSGFMVIRHGEVIYRSPIQQHRFNYPFQLGHDYLSECPNSAEELEVSVKSGDVIIAGTDGLFDNLYPREILRAVIEGITQGLMPQNLAQKIAEVALVNSRNREIDTPFSCAARLAGFKRIGGKVDDITVIVVYVV
ncbi:hypothetical protein QYF36_022624 [Acer negundo]|nr:hypothetical protein QYF36_022624 [Acer negundo]